MNFRENVMAILNYAAYEKLPIVSFGYWAETTKKWADEGYITKAESDSYCNFGDNSGGDQAIMEKLGFDYNWNSCVGGNPLLFPNFALEVLESLPDGSRIIRDPLGLICKDKPGLVSISSEIGTSLTDRKAWEDLYLPKLQMCPERVPKSCFEATLLPKDRSIPLGLHAGSLIGNMRNILGVEQMSYLYADDPELYEEIANTLCGLCYDCTKLALESGTVFDYVHFWEDICFKNGPLVSPLVFDRLIGPWYKRITQLCYEYGIHIISLDCDGKIDSLIPTWINNGVNTMFPIEVGTWEASIAPWREKYGRELRGVGGMNKTVFARNKEAIDREVERLSELIRLGGYIPCPDHRIAPDANFELVAYYCEQMHKL